MTLTAIQKTACSLLLPSWRILLLLVWATWWGGIFFYAVVAVPIGTDAIGAVEQGFLTQQVTRMHNGLSIVFLLCLLVEAIRLRSVIDGVLVATLALNLALMFVWHSDLTQAMDFEKRAVPATFYQRHAVYLWLFAAQWLQGMLVPILVLRAAERSQAGASERVSGLENRSTLSYHRGAKDHLDRRRNRLAP